MNEYLTILGVIMGIAAFLNSEKLRRRLNLTQDLLIKNGLIKNGDLIPGYPKTEEARTTESEKEAAAIVEKMMKK